MGFVLGSWMIHQNQIRRQSRQFSFEQENQASISKPNKKMLRKFESQTREEDRKSEREGLCWQLCLKENKNNSKANIDYKSILKPNKQGCCFKKEYQATNSELYKKMI